VLYVAFADLGRHKGRIEAFVTKSIGRPFGIDGPFTLRLVPVIEVSAERVRLGNVAGGSQPQMVEFGKAVVQVGFWSVISGPPGSGKTSLAASYIEARRMAMPTQPVTAIVLPLRTARE